MALTEKQYDALRAQAINQAKASGVSEKQLDNHKGELFPGEREYLIRTNPLGKKPPSSGMMFVVTCILGVLIALT